MGVAGRVEVGETKQAMGLRLQAHRLNETHVNPRVTNAIR